MNYQQTVPRFVDRDMVMRFHPGMAVGHTYQNTVMSAANHFSGTYGSHGSDNPSGA